MSNMNDRLISMRQILYTSHCFQSCNVVAWLSKIVGVNMNRMRHVKKLVNLAQSSNYFSRSDVKIWNGVIDVPHVSAEAPCLKTTWINQFYNIAFRSLYRPRNVSGAFFNHTLL